MMRRRRGDLSRRGPAPEDEDVAPGDDEDLPGWQNQQGDLGLFAEDDDEDEDGYPGGGPDEARPRRTRRRRFVTGAVIVVVLAIIGGVAWYGLHEILGIGYADYEGTGGTEVLVQVNRGDSMSAIGSTLVDAGVVASAHAFTSAGSDSAQLQALQPGYYVMREHMSGAAAAKAIVDPANKVGQAEIRPGSRLDDTKLPGGKVRPGIFTLLSKASCARLNGHSTCVPVDTLRHVAATADPAALGVPQWAVSRVRGSHSPRRLEGLIAPDIYQVRPGDSAEQILKSVLTDSSLRLQAEGMPEIAKGSGFTPYQLLIIASLSQSEAVKSDFGKVARVTYNRLAANHKLQYDSTVNYVLDRPEIRTQPSDRAKAGPYNTYQNTGLPPTPISSPSGAALKAAADPPKGDWMYFVKCYKSGKSCFAATAQQHHKNVVEAQQRGAY